MIFPALPPQLSIQPFFEHRTRFDRRLDHDLSSSTDDNRTGLLLRERAGVDFRYGSRWSGSVRAQYRLDMSWRAGKYNTSTDIDLSTAQVAYRAEDGTTYGLGRQNISKGDRRLLNVSDYSQRARVFDVARYSRGRWDLFAGQVGIDTIAQDATKIAGGTYDSKYGQTLLFYKRADNAQDITTLTAGQFYVGKSKTLSYQAEAALQAGKADGKDVSAFMVHGRATKPISTSTDVYAEVNVATGGGSNRTNRTFDPLYGSVHPYYGIMDIQALRNLVHFEVGLSHSFTPKLRGLISFNNFELYDATDGWYGGNGFNRRVGGFFVDPSGAKGKDVGQEYDISLVYQPNRHDMFILEGGLFSPGNFVRAFGQGKTANQYMLSLTYSLKL